MQVLWVTHAPRIFLSLARFRPVLFWSSLDRRFCLLPYSIVRKLALNCPPHYPLYMRFTSSQKIIISSRKFKIYSSKVGEEIIWQPIQYFNLFHLQNEHFGT